MVHAPTDGADCAGQAKWAVSTDLKPGVEHVAETATATATRTRHHTPHRHDATIRCDVVEPGN